jgi:hypothetical protein
MYPFSTIKRSGMDRWPVRFIAGRAGGGKRMLKIILLNDGGQKTAVPAPIPLHNN